MNDTSVDTMKSNASAVEQAISRRRSVRHFTDQKIPLETLERLVRAGINAPSGSNWQNQRFLVITEAEEIMRIGRERFVWPYKGANQEKTKKSHPGGIIGHAAAVIMVFSDSKENDRRGNGEYHIWQSLEIQNCAASIENILILATSMGIGTCWISASDKMNYTRMMSGGSWRTLLANYEIPPYYNLQGIIILGYPKDKDEGGYPKGERMHGATVWQSTDREPTKYYLIRKRASPASSHPALSSSDRILLRTLSSCIRKLQKAAARLDQWIHRIEFGKYLAIPDPP